MGTGSYFTSHVAAGVNQGLAYLELGVQADMDSAMYPQLLEAMRSNAPHGGLRYVALASLHCIIPYTKATDRPRHGTFAWAWALPSGF